MEIIRQVEGLGWKVVGRRCDCCKRDWRGHRSLEEQFETFEFTRIEVNAGYGAVRFVDGDRLVADLCQYCTHALLSNILRKLGNEFEMPVTPGKWNTLRSCGSMRSSDASAHPPSINERCTGGLKPRALMLRGKAAGRSFGTSALCRCARF
ncbi:MAG: hypothetical protein K0S14_392 [Thermomicrobiales bacterium]|jgi:hypothetical protein|nr:hypothetical protein [Thermomicrobiales bacterium]